MSLASPEMGLWLSNQALTLNYPVGQVHSKGLRVSKHDCSVMGLTHLRCVFPGAHWVLTTAVAFAGSNHSIGMSLCGWV